MGSGFLIPVAMLASLSGTRVTFAQQAPRISCPQGQSQMNAVDLAGKIESWCYPNAGRGMAYDPPMKAAIQKCRGDADCTGILRCQNGRCGRTNTTREA